MAGTFKFVTPAGGFYVFPKVRPKPGNCTAFVETAIKNNILVIPGNVFSRRDTHFRVRYALPDDKLLKGCETLCSITR